MEQQHLLLFSEKSYNEASWSSVYTSNMNPSPFKKSLYIFWSCDRMAQKTQALENLTF